MVMGYRRSKQSADEKRCYETFCKANGDLIQQIGLPGLVYEDENSFVYFLMHGSLCMVICGPMRR